MFKMIDADGSGQITLEELKKGLEKVGANIKDSEIVHLMEAVKLSLQSHCFHVIYMIYSVILFHDSKIGIVGRVSS